MTRTWFLDGVSEFMGFRYEAPGRIRLAVRPDLVNPGGLLSGAVPFALIDYAMGSALWQEVTDEEAIATINVAINYVATVRSGDVVCSASVDRRTRTNAVLRGEVVADDGKLLATAVGSYAIFTRKGPSPTPPDARPALP